MITLISTKDTHTRPRGTNPIDASNKNITVIQLQDLNKGIQMATILNGRIGLKKIPCLMDSDDNENFNQEISQ